MASVTLPRQCDKPSNVQLDKEQMIWPLKKWLEWIISSERRAGQADVSDGFALGSRLNGVLALFCELTSMPAQA